MRLAANLGVVSQINELPALNREAEFLKDVPSHRLQQALKDLDRVYLSTRTSSRVAGHTRSRGASATATASRTSSSSA